MKKEYLFCISLFLTTTVFAQQVDVNFKSGSLKVPINMFYLFPDEDISYRYMYFNIGNTVENINIRMDRKYKPSSKRINTD